MSLLLVVCIINVSVLHCFCDITAVYILYDLEKYFNFDNDS